VCVFVCVCVCVCQVIDGMPVSEDEAFESEEEEKEKLGGFRSVCVCVSV